jgi:hypothetical protein
MPWAAVAVAVAETVYSPSTPIHATVALSMLQSTPLSVCVLACVVQPMVQPGSPEIFNNNINEACHQVRARRAQQQTDTF